MPIKAGDFILADYTCKVKESGEVIDTTISKVAEEAKLHKHDAVYELMFIVVGEGWVTKGLDEGLSGLEMGKTATIEVSPEKGYGTRDPSKMKLIPLRRFKADGVMPVPGMQLEIDRKPALIRSVGAGRVQVDFNHPLAGKTLIYEVSIASVIEAKEEKIKAIIHRRLPSVAKEKFGLTLAEKELTIEIPEEAFFLEGLQLAKRMILTDLEKLIPEIEKISFIEVFKKPKLPEAKPPVEAKPEQVQTSPGIEQPAQTQ